MTNANEFTRVVIQELMAGEGGCNSLLVVMLRLRYPSYVTLYVSAGCTLIIKCWRLVCRLAVFKQSSSQRFSLKDVCWCVCMCVWVLCVSLMYDCHIYVCAISLANKRRVYQLTYLHLPYEKLVGPSSSPLPASVAAPATELLRYCSCSCSSCCFCCCCCHCSCSSSSF